MFRIFLKSIRSAPSMLNKDINSRFEDWLLNPSEGLDFEVKQWLNMDDPESQGIIAKALIALENHGGGFLLLGYREDEHKRLEPDPNRPASMEPYLGDSLNAIVKRRAEPAFHVEVTLQMHPKTGAEYPLVRVPGTSKVPIRSESATAGGALKQNVYYIRAPGPESRGPRDGTEWDALLRRSILNQREDIVRALRGIIGIDSGLALPTQPTEMDELMAFVINSESRWSTLNASLPDDHPSKIKLGHFRFAARAIGKSKDMKPVDILQVNDSSRDYTGWPPFATIYREHMKPAPFDGCIEAWLAHIDTPDVGHADFWRIRPDGYFFLLRGYQEDSTDPHRRVAEPGTSFEATLPIWRLGEFLLRVADLATAMFEGEFEILVDCEWTGLTGRRLFVDKFRRAIRAATAAQDNAHTSGRFPGTIRDILPEAVRMLLEKLYQQFDFLEISPQMYAEELSDMTKGKF